MVGGKMFLKLFCAVLVTFNLNYYNNSVHGQTRTDKIGIGVVFDQNTEEIQNAFKFAMMQHTSLNTSRRLDFQAYVDIINTADAFKLSRLICNQFARGVWSMLGAVSPDSFDTLHSYTNTFQMPFVTPWFPEKVKPPSSGLIDHAVSLRPDYHKGVIDTITYYGWKTVIYMYDSHDGLLRLQQLYASMQPGNATFRISHVKRVGNASDAVQYLCSLERLDRWSNKYVVLDSNTRLAKDVIISHVRDVQLGRRNYHYFLSGLVMDDHWEREINEFGAINVTGFRVLDFSRKFVRDFIDVWKREYHSQTISAQAALMYDGVQVLIDTFGRLQRKKPDIFRGSSRRATLGNYSKVIDCNPVKGKVSPFEHGDKIYRLIKKTEIEGLSGMIRFTDDGHRNNFSLQVVEMTVDGHMEQVAIWHDYKGLIPVVPKLHSQYLNGVYDRNRTFIISTILEAPYLQLRVPGSTEVKSNSGYKGFCKDLADMISQKLEIKYELRLVKIGKYGKEDPTIVGGWDGIIGEIVRKEADMAIAPLTITLEREMVVDFSKPFLSLDLNSNRSKKKMSTVFSFLKPLSKELWICILFSHFAVSMVLFLVSKFSPLEWRLLSFTDIQQSNHNHEVQTSQSTVVNEFSFWNSMWFSLGSFLQQGSDLVPRSVSGRIVSTVWWFFTLIVISFYTANLASHLTINRINDPFFNMGILTACSLDLSAGVTGIPLDGPLDEPTWFSKVFYSTSTTEHCEMAVSLSKDGFKEFAVAFPKKSPLREGVNLALQALKDDGDLQKLIQKWFSRSDCQSGDQGSHGTELTLDEVAGIFYVLIAGLALALGVALLEFCQHGRSAALRANVPLRTALRAKPHLNSGAERKSPPEETPTSEGERLGWNGGAAYAEFYMPANQNGHEETALHGSFAQV
ncbi:glutamate receptor 1 isoform X1 [Plutella xylostella]|uniref:glutamate receptor 1 isoform X1 n=1 Tax=Plutella xylostella TaxID=51655 RepID=UPI0020321B46|nr:glutamate receptor 1 isoform X1 [Plutella xylostella]